MIDEYIIAMSFALLNFIHYRSRELWQKKNLFLIRKVDGLYGTVIEIHVSECLKNRCYWTGVVSMMKVNFHTT